MDEEELQLSADPSSIVDSLASKEEELREQGAHHEHGAPIETVREATYRNHSIVVKTTYSITVDGMSVEGHLGVSNDGQVHYHAIPNLGFSSAIELAQKLIDTFPEDFGDTYGDDDVQSPDEDEEPPPDDDEPEPEHEHGDHEHGEDDS